MKKDAKSQLKEVSAKETSKHSIETAVKYLIEECHRINDIQAAGVLEKALKDFKKRHPMSKYQKKDEQLMIHIVREALRLSKTERAQLICHLDGLNKKAGLH